MDEGTDPVFGDEGEGRPTVTLDRDRAARWSSTDWRIAGALVALEALLLALHGVRGPNFVLDDFWILEQGVFDGVFGATDHALEAARPGTAIAYGATFGLFGNHPLPIFLVQGVLLLACVVVVYAALRRFLSPLLAGATVAVWIYLPNHVSLEVWTTTSILVLSLFFLALGVLLAARPEPSRTVQVLSLIAFGLAPVFYEAALPTAAALIVAVPFLVERRLRFGYVAAGAVMLGGELLWLVTHWHNVKHVSAKVADVSQMLPAHFGWGVVGEGIFSSILTGVVMAGVLVVAVRVVRRRRVDEPGEAMVLCGLALMIVGTLPFVTYFYAPLGAGDRFNYISSVGGALVWVGLAAVFWRYRALVVTAGVVVFVAAGLTRWQRVGIWDQAGDDGVAILDATKRQIPEPSGTIAFGPTPIQRENVAAFLDHSNIASGVRVWYGDRSLTAVMTFDEASFQTFDADHRVDINEVSGLHPDVVVTPGSG